MFMPAGLAIQMPVGQMPVVGARTFDRNTRRIYNGGPPWICGQQNVRATARHNIGQNTNKGRTPCLKMEIKISDPAGWNSGTLTDIVSEK